MKNEKGITLISLVITIILMMILIAVGAYIGIETYENMRVQAFITKMKTLQEAVDRFCDEYSIQEINTMGQNFSSAPSDAQEVLSSVITEGEAGNLNSWFALAGDNGSANYRYFSISDISSILGIKDFDTGIFVNPKTRNVIAIEGVTYEGKRYYRQYDFDEGQILPEPNTDTDFTLDISVKTFDNKAVIYVNTDKNIIELRYRKKYGETYEDDRISPNLNQITITESGVYQVEAKTTSLSDSTNGVVTKTSENVTIAIVNKPLLVEGLVPIKYNGTSEIDTTADDEDWYNYGEKKWANAKLNDGSVYVWIPRYAYSIDKTNKKIDVEFMKETSSVITTSGKALNSSYKVMPAFQDGATTGYVNGEWDSELNGIWVAKYETTAQTVNEKSYPQNSLLHSESWRGLVPIDAFNICREMEALDTTTYFSSSVSKASGNYNYGTYSIDTNNIDTHLMKNSEWGAVAYLSYSAYGRQNQNPSIAADYYIDNYASNEYSTTNNRYGLFGFSGGALDMVAAGRQIKEAGFNSENKSTKYATYYAEESYNTIFGDAVEETKGWKNCRSVYSTELFGRGGHKNDSGSEGNSGIFAYQNKNLIARDTVTFRPVLIIEY